MVVAFNETNYQAITIALNSESTIPDTFHASQVLPTLQDISHPAVPAQWLTTLVYWPFSSIDRSRLLTTIETYNCCFRLLASHWGLFSSPTLSVYSDATTRIFCCGTKCLEWTARINTYHNMFKTLNSKCSKKLIKTHICLVSRGGSRGGKWHFTFHLEQFIRALEKALKGMLTK